MQAFEHPAVRSGEQYTVFDLPDGWRAGILICYDRSLIENVRITALQGADLLIAPHQTGASGAGIRGPRLDTRGAPSSTGL